MIPFYWAFFGTLGAVMGILIAAIIAGVVGVGIQLVQKKLEERPMPRRVK